MKGYQFPEPYSVEEKPADRVLVVAFTDGRHLLVPVSDQTVFRINGSAFSFQGCCNVLLVAHDDSLLDSLDETRWA